MLFSILSLNAKINTLRFEGKASAKKILIRNIVFLSIILIILGYTNGYTMFADYLDLVYKNILFVLVTAVIFVTASNSVTLPTCINLVKKEKNNEKKETNEG